MNRRNFLGATGLLLGSTVLSSPLLSKGKQKYDIGYAAITWGGKDVQAIEDVSSLGFRHIQLRGNTYKDYQNKLGELKDLLAKHKLKPTVFSSGNLNPGPDVQAQLEKHLTHAKFVKELGGKYMQVTNSARQGEGTQDPALIKEYARLLTDLGKKVSDQGISLVYHNHMHQLGETPEEVDMILEHSDEKHVKLLLDIAHYHRGGGDPAKAFAKYASRTKAIHLKDWKESVDGKYNYKFCELGQGKVDLPAFFQALDKYKFDGIAMVELDAVPDAGKTPLQCAQTSKAYLLSQNLTI